MLLVCSRVLSHPRAAAPRGLVSSLSSDPLEAEMEGVLLPLVGAGVRVSRVVLSEPFCRALSFLLHLSYSPDWHCCTPLLTVLADTALTFHFTTPTVFPSRG